MSEFSKQFDSLGIVSSGRLLCRRVMAKMSPPLIKVYVRYPETIVFTKMNALVPTCAVEAKAAVVQIIHLAALAKIKATAIQSIVVPVVNLYQRVSYSQYLPMKQDSRLASHPRTERSPFGVKGFCSAVPKCVPLVHADAFVVGSVNDSNLSLRQRDFTIIFKEWERHARIILRVGLGRVLSTPDAPMIARTFA